ncbi:MAG: response regulator, partial [Deltaproteobacteria bacterium]|nr:response regulator [Deltaproteobacteria bacterium]
MTDGGDEGSDQGTLAVARRRFMDGLPRKASELRAGLALLAASPDGAKPQKEMRRRVHALLASAQVFRLDALEDALRDAVHLLDQARALGRALDQDELDQLANLVATLPALVGTGRSEGAPTTAPFPPAPTSRMGSVVPAEPSPGGAAAGAPERGTEGRRAHSTLRMGAVARPGAGASPDAPGDVSHGAPSVSRRAPTAAAPTSTARGPEVVSVLVVDGVETQSAVRAMLAVESFEVTGAADPEEALRLARSTAPDVVLADRAIVHRPGVDLVGRLRSDPLTDFVPIVLVLPTGAPNDPVAVREIGADDAIERPIDPAQLRATIARVVAAAQGAPAPPDALPDLNLHDLAERVADEVRRGIVAAADRGADLTVPLAGGGEVLAATWAAVSRIRSYVARRTGGRVHFRDPPGRGPALLALVGGTDDALPDSTAGEVALEGRRALVVDDDPSIVWFFAGLLRSAGMVVHESFSGTDALAVARRERPELVVTDILMPGLDGFALLRELRRDVLLADVPVIVLSWKEDFLQRMRELDAPANAYLRKEVGAAEALLRVKEVLRPRARVEAALRRDDDVRGRLERLGFPALVEVVSRHWPDARIVVRDAAHLFELDIRAGAPADVTRTAVDGTFARGAAAFLNLVGLRSGRFTVQRATSSVRATLHGTLDELLRDAAERIGAAIDAVSGSALVRASRVRVDDAAADAIESTSPEPMRSLIARLRDGDSPRALITSGEVEGHVLETCLVDLARRGAILAVRGLEGEDRLAEMLQARTSPPPRPSSRPVRSESEPPQPIRLSDPELKAVVLSDVAERSTTPPPTPPDARPSTAHPPPRASAPAPRQSTPPVRESASPTARITDPPILRLSDPDLGRADDTPRTLGQRRTLELVGEDSALAAAVAALVAPPSAEAAPAPRPSRPSSSTPAPRTSAAPAEPQPPPAASPPSEPPLDPFALDEAFRPAVTIPVPVLPLSTATARATKSDPPERRSEPPALTASSDSVPSLDDSGELIALMAEVRASAPPVAPAATRASEPVLESRASAPPA